MKLFKNFIMLSKLQQFSFFLFLLKKYTKNCRNLYISPKGNISMDGITQKNTIEQNEVIEEEQKEKWTVAEILAKISGIEYDWIMIFASDEDDDPWVWTRKTGWNLEPVPYSREIKDFWLEKDEDGIGIKIILKDE